ncbi:pyridoxal phosphate-dependent transferase [Lipomyces kononenkoae]|uniref:Pyridoxal phosphate-dependent transferase n=1 Tax=Lipomyces kononenkoae TaxID=34357 RepID=A0ACC3TB94_LIPKO
MTSKTQIDLRSGFPAPGLLPANRLNDAANSVLTNQLIWTPGMVYGADEGYLPLRENVAKWLTEFYAPSEPIGVNRITITGGASQNLACILQVFTDPVATRNIWVVEPAYYLAFRVFEDAGFYGRLRGVPEDEEGIDISYLEDALEESVKSGTIIEKIQPFKPPVPYRKLYKHVIYCVPTFSNPSGTIMSLSRREALVRLARKYDALIISDDVYDFVHWTPSIMEEPKGDLKALLPRLVDIDRTLDGGPIGDFGNTVSNGSFSKIISPGCRVGWAEGTPKMAYGISQVGSTRSGGAPSQLMSTFVNELLIDGSLNERIRTHLLPEYKRRHSVLLSAVKEYLFPLGISFHADPTTTNPNPQGPIGGFFLWLRLPSPLTATEVEDISLRDANVIFGNGGLAALPEGNKGIESYDDRIRLCFAWSDEDLLAEGVMRLGDVIRKLLDERK